MQECPICEKKLTPDQFENHYMKELELVKADKIVEKRTKRNAAILASQQLKKGRKMKLDENEQILCKLKASRLKRQNLDNSDILQFNQKKKKKFLDATEKELSLLNQICFMCQKPLPLDTHLVNLHIDECLAISCNVENASNNLDNGNNSFKKSNDWEEYTWAGQTRVRATSLLQGNYEDIGYSVNKKTDKDVDEDVEIEEESSTIYGNSHLSEEALQQFFTATDENVSELKIDTNVETAFLDENALIVKNLNNDKIDDNLLDVENEDSDSDQELTLILKNPSIPPDSKLIIESLKMEIKTLKRFTNSNREKSSNNDNDKIFNIPNCLICLNFYDKPCVSINCWHVHCEKCWLQSLAFKRVCPQCQIITAPTELRQIFI